jgi:hypothetical protein
MTRTLPIVLLSTLVIGAGYTLAINQLLGGSVETAPVRVLSAEQVSERAGLPGAADHREGFPKMAGSPRLWRHTETEGRRKATRRRSARRNASSNHKSRVRSAPKPSTTPRPSSSAPSGAAQTVSPQVRSPVISRPAPSKPRPAPSPKPKPNRGSSNGGNFYSTG